MEDYLPYGMNRCEYKTKMNILEYHLPYIVGATKSVDIDFSVVYPSTEGYFLNVNILFEFSL